MATIKKKELKTYKVKEPEEIEELVDADGSEIEGDRTPTNDSEIEVPDQQTSDEFAKSAIQPNRMYYAVGGTAYSHGARVQSENEVNEAKNKLKKMVEDLLSNRNNTSDIVKKRKYSDVNRNDIPDLEELATKHQKPIAAKRAQEILNSIKKNNLNGEELGIVLNYIITNIDTNQLPNDYKRIIKGRL